MEEREVGQVTIYNPAALSPPVGFAHAAAARGFVFLGGQIGSDASGTILHPGDIVAQFRQAIGNVRTALEAAGCTPGDVVKLTYFVTDVAAYRAALGPIGTAYREIFGKRYPATSLFEVKGLFDPA